MIAEKAAQMIIEDGLRGGAQGRLSVSLSLEPELDLGGR
jgi:hypothetical protein